jgi:quinol monooxygenase YgiN
MVTTRDFLTGMGAAVLGFGMASGIRAQASTSPFIRWAGLDIDPAKLGGFKAAAAAHGDAVIRTEPGIAAFHAAAEADNPGRIHVFEMYDDAKAYQAHVQQAHFRHFRATTEGMVTSRRIHDAVAIKLGAKARLVAVPLVRIAELEIDPAQLPAYEAAVSEEIDDSIRLEPGVLTLYAVALADQRNHLRFFEIYAHEVAYRQHLESAHFKKYVETTKPMIRSRKLFETRPVYLGLRQR